MVADHASLLVLACQSWSSSKWPWEAENPLLGPSRWWAGRLGSDPVWGVGRSSEICEGPFISQRLDLPCL